MKILYISHLHPPDDQPLESVGGMQNVSVQLVEALKRRSDVEIETIILKASWKHIGFYSTVFLFKLLYLIPKAVKEFQPDVILFSSMVTAGVVPFLSKKITVPKVTINHGQDVTLPLSIYQKYLPWIFKSLDGVISVSSATRDACIKRGMPPEKGVALPNGFDNRRKFDLSSKPEAKKWLAQKLQTNLEDGYLLLTVGRQVRRKGHEWFVREVLPKIKSEVHYLIIGDGPEFENIRLAVENSPDKSKICLAGRQPDNVLNKSYSAADLFVMPNIPVEGDMEGFGIVLLEANQAGVPAVASNLEGIRDVIEQGENGYRVPHSKPNLFASKIDEILNGDLKYLSKSSKKYVERNFSWDSVVSRYLNFLEEVAFK